MSYKTTLEAIKQTFGENLLFASLKGSQLKGIATEDSDFDFLVVTKQSMRRLVQGNTKKSQRKVNGEDVQELAICNFVKNLYKSSFDTNISLFADPETQMWFANDTVKDFYFSHLYNHRDVWMYHNEKAIYHSVYGALHSDLKRMEKHKMAQDVLGQKKYCKAVASAMYMKLFAENFFCKEVEKSILTEKYSDIQAYYRRLKTDFSFAKAEASIYFDEELSTYEMFLTHGMDHGLIEKEKSSKLFNDALQTIFDNNRIFFSD